MRKKIVPAMFFIILLLIGSTALAGDIPEGILAGNQQALFIGRILTVSKDTIAIAPLTVMMGKVNEKTVAVKPFKSYYGTSGSPKRQDYVVIRLLDGTTVDDLWIFKCSSGDYKTLKLISIQYDMVQRYQKYINEGAYFEAQKKLDAKASGSPASPSAAPSPPSNPPASAETAAVLASAPAGNNPLTSTLLLGASVALLLIVLLLLFFTRKRARQG